MATFETRRPFTRADALAAGVTPKQLRGSKFRRIFQGVYIDERVPDHPLIRAGAALLVHPEDAYASHFSAARIYRVPVPVHPNEHVTVSCREDRSQRDGITCHVASPAPANVAAVRGLRVSSPASMFVELASVLTLVDLVVVGDALLRLKLVRLSQLLDFCAASNDRYAALARKASRYVRAKVDSAMESRLRMLIVLAGLPEPEVNHEIVDDYGITVMKFDLSYLEIKLIIEYDGRQHGERSQQWLHDLKRREQLDDDRWRILIVTSEGIYQSPGETIERVRRALRERGYRPVPPRSQAWRPFFPGR